MGADTSVHPRNLNDKNSKVNPQEKKKKERKKEKRKKKKPFNISLKFSKVSALIKVSKKGTKPLQKIKK